MGIEPKTRCIGRSYSRIRLWAEESGLAVVMPSGENSFYMDILVEDGCLGDFGEYVGRELIDVTRNMFPLSSKREDTFLGGLSMGGFGACRNALKYSDTFRNPRYLMDMIKMIQIKNFRPFILLVDYRMIYLRQIVP